MYQLRETRCGEALCAGGNVTHRGGERETEAARNSIPSRIMQPDLLHAPLVVLVACTVARLAYVIHLLAAQRRCGNFIILHTILVLRLFFPPYFPRDSKAITQFQSRYCRSFLLHTSHLYFTFIRYTGKDGRHD